MKKIILIILLAGFGLLVFMQIEKTMQSKTEKEDQSILSGAVNKDYVTLISGGGVTSPHEAVFEFADSVKLSDIVSSNIVFCVRSVSVGAEESGQSNKDCNSLPEGSNRGIVSEASISNGFSLDYDLTNMKLTVSDTDKSNPSMGSFFIGCASCTSNVKFTGVYNVNGTLLPDVTIQVY